MGESALTEDPIHHGLGEELPYLTNMPPSHIENLNP